MTCSCGFTCTLCFVAGMIIAVVLLVAFSRWMDDYREDEE